MHLKFGRKIAGLLLLIATAISIPAQSKEIDIYEFWTVAEVQGTIMARTGDNPWSEPRLVSAGERVGPYSVVEAGADSEAILVRGGDRMTLYANTEIELPPMDRATGITRILQRTGEVLFRIKKRGQREFEVETPYLVAGVRGTTFGITATDATSQLHVVEGAVAVRSADDHAARETMVQALENATTGLGLLTQSETAPLNTVAAWDDRTIHQAETCDHLMVNGPEAVREALSHRPLFTAGTTDPSDDIRLTDVQDIAMRIAEREKLAVDRAVLEPTATNQAAAELARSSSTRLAAAGLALDAAREMAPARSRPITAIATPEPADLATPPAPVSPDPSNILQSAPAATPALISPEATEPAAQAPRQLRTPRERTASPDTEATEATEATVGDAVDVPEPEGDGVVYTTFGIQTDEETQETDPTDPILLPQPDLNIEGVGAGN